MNTSSTRVGARWTAEQASPEQQAERRRQVFARVREITRERIVREEGKTYVPYYELDGSLNLADTRVYLWIAEAYLHGTPEDRKLGNEMLASIEFNHACHFSGAGSATLLIADKALLEPAAVANLERFLLRYFSDWMTSDYRFQGANDNAPAGCVAALSLGGQYFNNPTLVEFARQRLALLDHVIDFRGYINECNSPTYSPITLMDICSLAEYSTDAATRAMALRVEQRVWQELLLHFHPEIKHQVGPFSRGYPDDNAAQCTMGMLAMYAAFGEVTPFHPLAMLFPPT
ncbi:MAG TPA: hypothetical protein VGM23_14175, partial [Armatimonadota bacterium]